MNVNKYEMNEAHISIEIGNKNNKYISDHTFQTGYFQVTMMIYCTTPAVKNIFTELKDKLSCSSFSYSP